MWRLAWRNLWRNRTRTMIAGSAIAISFSALLASFGMSDYVHNQTLKAGRMAAGGDVLVHQKGYWDTQSGEIVIKDPSAIEKLVSGAPGVRAVIPRVLLTGLVASSKGSTAARLVGTSPEREAPLRDLRKDIKKGGFEAPRGKHPLVLGKKIVEELEIDLGDRVVLTTTDLHGQMTRVLFRLTGVIESGSDVIDGSAAYTTLAGAQAAAEMGQAVTQLALVVEEGRPAPSVRDAVRAALGGGAAGDLELLTNEDAFAELRAGIEIDNQMSLSMVFVLFVVVGFGIANTFLMVVFERVREFGLLAALGLTPRRIGLLLVEETTILALLSLAIGLTIALGQHAYLAEYGLPIGALSENTKVTVGNIVVEMTMKSHLNEIKWALGALGVVVVIVVSSLYPALRAARVDPAQAMRTYE